MLQVVPKKFTLTVCSVGFCGGLGDAVVILRRRAGSVPVIPALAARKVIGVHVNAISC